MNKIAVAFLLISGVILGGKLWAVETCLKQQGFMKVKFYTLDIEKREKGELVGEAEIKGNKSLVLNICDSKLKDILSKPYRGLKGEVRGNEFIDQQTIYSPGTAEHLKAIALECYKFGYWGEILENKKEVER